MAYNQLAESFSRAAKVLFADTQAGVAQTKRGFSFPDGWSKFDELYSEIADATPTDGTFRTSSLLDDPSVLPLISGYSLSCRRDIVQVVLRDMRSLPADCDGLERVGGGLYRWRFADRAEAA